MLTFFARSNGRQYLTNTLGPFIKQLPALGSLEVDPNKLREGETVQANMPRLKNACTTLVTSIVNSLDDCPQ